MVDMYQIHVKDINGVEVVELGGTGVKLIGVIGPKRVLRYIV
jgi:hypothetical protein